jgi:hypothetical protein
MIYFIVGTVFGALLMFLARLADKNITKIVEQYEKNGATFTRPKPIIVPPPKDDIQILNEALQEQLKKEYGS